MEIKAGRAQLLWVMLQKARVRGPFSCRLRQADHLFPGQTLRVAGTEPGETGHRILLDPIPPHELDTQITSYFTEPRDLTRREELINTLVERIRGAEQRVWVAVYAFTNARLCQALIEAKHRGIDVRVIMDPAQAAAPNAQKAELERGGVKVVTGDLTMHHKFCLVDHAQIYLGSFNWTSANIMNYEDYTCIGGKSSPAQNTITRYEERFSNLWEMFMLKSGTLVPPGRLSPLLEELGFYAFCHDSGLSLGQVKIDEVALSRLTPHEFRKMGELHRRRGYTFHVSRYKLILPLIEKIPPQFEYLRKLVLACLVKKRIDYFNNYLFFGAASTTRRHHKAHVNQIGGLFAHHREVVAWTELLAQHLGIPEQTRAEAIAAACLHDPFPVFSPKDVPGFKAAKTAEIVASRCDPQLRSNESIQRILSAIRNHPHIWGNTPLTAENNMVDWILFLANYFASSRDIFLTADIRDRDPRALLRELLERPFPNPNQTYSRLVDNYDALCEEDKKVLAVTYALLPAFVLTPQEVRRTDGENLLLTEKAPAVKAILQESLAIRRTGAKDTRITPAALANLVCGSGAIQVITYDNVLRMLEGAEQSERKWAVPAKTDASAKDFQELMFKEHAGEFLPEIEKEFRQLLNLRSGERQPLEPIWEKVILWMVRKAQTLDPARLYAVFYGALNTPGQRKRFQNLLARASHAVFEAKTIQMLEKLLAHFLVPKSVIPAVSLALTCHPALGKQRSLKNISAVLHNSGLRSKEIKAVMQRLETLRPQYTSRYICEVNDALLSARINRKLVLSVMRQLVGNDLKEVETMGQKVSRVLKEAGVDCIKREGAERRVEAVLAQETDVIIRELEAFFKDIEFPKGSGVIPEFETVAAVLHSRGEKIRPRHGFEWKKTADADLLERARVLKETIQYGQPLTIRITPDLKGTLGEAMVVEALRREAEICYREQHPPQQGEDLFDYGEKARRHAREQVAYAFDPAGFNGEHAFELARAIHPVDGLGFLDLNALQVLSKEGKLTAEEKAKVFWGLQLLNNRTRNIGINAVIEAKDLSLREVDEGIAGFQILPVLEAGCQRGQPERVMELLLAENRVAALTQLEVLMKMETEIATDPSRTTEKPSSASPLKLDGELDLALVSPGLEALIAAAFGPFNPNNEQGNMEDRPVFLIRGVEYANWLCVGQYNSHRTLQLSGHPAFWRRANTKARWEETGNFLLKNSGEKVDVAASVGSYRKGNNKITNLEIADIKKEVH